MKKALLFFDKNKEVAFATSSANIPNIRIFQIMLRIKCNFYFATAPHKEVYKQIMENKNVEFIGSSANISVRIVGQTLFDIDDETQLEIYNKNSVLARIYSSYKDLVYFRVKPSRIDYTDITPTPPLYESFNI